MPVNTALDEALNKASEEAVAVIIKYTALIKSVFPYKKFMCSKLSPIEMHFTYAWTLGRNGLITTTKEEQEINLTQYAETAELYDCIELALRLEEDGDMLVSYLKSLANKEIKERLNGNRRKK